MNITDQKIEKVIKNAALDLNATEKKELSTSLRNAVSWIEKLQEVDTQGVAPLITLSEESNYFAEDLPQEASSRGDILSVAPHQDGVYFHVPQKK